MAFDTKLKQLALFHRVLAVAQYVGGREIRQSRLPAFYRRKPFEE